LCAMWVILGMQLQLHKSTNFGGVKHEGDC